MHTHDFSEEPLAAETSRTLARPIAALSSASDGRSPAARRDAGASRAAGGEAAPAKETD